MKRIVFLAILMIPIMLHSASWRSGKLPSITVVDSIAVADTVAAVVRADTGISEIIDVTKYRFLEFYIRVVSDSDFTADTFYVSVQFSADKGGIYDWQTVTDTHLVKLTDTDSAYVALTLRLDTLQMLADKMRFIVSHRDSIEAGFPQGLHTNTYNSVFDIWFKGWD